MELAEEIQRQAEKNGMGVEALIQVKTTGETSKAGFEPEAVPKAMEQIRKMNRIQLRGLMTIGPTPVGEVPDEKQTRICFSKLRMLRDELRQKFPDWGLTELSMGMSSDFEWAIEEGATMVRIGTAVFGEQNAA